jgi:hypothetical protein
MSANKHSVGERLGRLALPDSDGGATMIGTADQSIRRLRFGEADHDLHDLH